MHIDNRYSLRVMVLITLMVSLTVLSTRLRADTGTCAGASITIPFTDVSPSNIFFCSIAAAYFSGLTNGTSATSFSPSDPVPREQIAAFVTRTLDQSLKRGSKRAALRQFWTTQGPNNLGLTTVGSAPFAVETDGTDIWVPNQGSGTVSRVRASDGRLLEEWTGATSAAGVLVAMGKVFIIGASNQALYQIDPTQPAGPVTTLSTSLGDGPSGIAYDGQRLWTANFGTGANNGSVSIIGLNPITVTNVSTAFNALTGILYDGANIWVTDRGDNTLKKLDSNGAILMSVSMGIDPFHPAFDGTNIWVPNASDNTVTVVRATGGLAGTVIATLTGNGLNFPFAAAFDGERILVTNRVGHSVSLWKASDLIPIGNFSTGTDTFPAGACSDGVNFWITLETGPPGKLARF